jgi:hypothetical protein
MVASKISLVIIGGSTKMREVYRSSIIESNVATRILV